MSDSANPSQNPNDPDDPANISHTSPSGPVLGSPGSPGERVTFTASLADVAVAYAAELGWPVLPASPTSKRPLIKTGKDHAEHASTDPGLIRHWFTTQFPGAEIAIPTGAASGVIIIDADAKHDGERLLVDLEDRYGLVPRDHIVRTQNRGIHAYASHPKDGRRIRSVVGGDSAPWSERGVDVRADGGIVLLPSTLPGARYVWETFASGVFAPLPDAWLAALEDRKHYAITPAVQPVYVESPDLEKARDSLRSLRTKYRKGVRDGDGSRGDLLDRMLTGRALAEVGNRDTCVNRAGYIVGVTLPYVGPTAASSLAMVSIIAMPSIADGCDWHHWDLKFRRAYERGAAERQARDEKDRAMWRSFGEGADSIGKVSP